MLIGLVVTLAGCVIGGLSVGYLGQVGLGVAGYSDVSEATALMGERVYPRVGMDVLLGRVLTIALVAIAASLYPAWHASRCEPAEALHYV